MKSRSLKSTGWRIRPAPSLARGVAVEAKRECIAVSVLLPKLVAEALRARTSARIQTDTDIKQSMN